MTLGHFAHPGLATIFAPPGRGHAACTAEA
jgi:hypothetical protein